MSNQKRELPKLPQARMFLKAAQWGYDELLKNRLQGYAFRFHLIGVLASLRAVQHSLQGHDRTLSAEHARVIGEWWKNTPLTIPELHFIRTSRNLLLKRGRFPAYATYSEGATGEGANREITHVDYDLAYYDENEERQDLDLAIKRALKWCDRELSAMEAQLPRVFAPD